MCWSLFRLWNKSSICGPEVRDGGIGGGVSGSGAALAASWSSLLLVLGPVLEFTTLCDPWIPCQLLLQLPAVLCVTQGRPGRIEGARPECDAAHSGARSYARRCCLSFFEHEGGISGNCGFFPSLVKLKDKIFLFLKQSEKKKKAPKLFISLIWELSLRDCRLWSSRESLTL